MSQNKPYKFNTHITNAEARELRRDHRLSYVVWCKPHDRCAWQKYQGGQLVSFATAENRANIFDDIHDGSLPCFIAPAYSDATEIRGNLQFLRDQDQQKTFNFG